MSGATVFVIPMAGASSRFFEAGFKHPKFMLPAFRKTIFHFAVGSFEAYFKTNPFIFITNDDPEVDAFVRREVEKMGLADAKFVQVDRLTDGQAETVALGLEACDVSGDTPITIFNIDSFRPGFSEPKSANFASADGYLEVFEGEGDHWSFAKVSADDDTQVTETSEKNRISPYCSNGLYHFKRAADFLQAFKEERADGTGTELYVAPLFNRLIAAGKNIRMRLLAPNETKFCGLPTEYRDFLLSGANDAWDAETIEDAPDLETLSMRDFHQAKAAGQKEKVVWVLRNLGSGKPLDARLLNTAIRHLHLADRSDDINALITLALFAANDNIDETIIIAEATFMTGRHQKTVQICDKVKETHALHTKVLFFGAQALSRCMRGHEMSGYIGGHTFLDLAEDRLEVFSFILADNGFTRKARHILQANWAARPGPGILHALMKLSAREGHGRTRMRLVESAIKMGVQPRKVDRMHAAAIAQRTGAQDTYDILDPLRELPAPLFFDTPQILGSKPSVALCLSGQMRGFEQASTSIKEHIIDRFDADVFVSTWDNRGITASVMRDLSRILPSKLAKTLPHRRLHRRFAENFPTLTRLIEDVASAPITESSINKHYDACAINIVEERTFEKEFFDQGRVEFLENRKPLLNQMKMYYQLDACNRLKLQQEAMTHKRYDIVIRLRPDLQLAGPIVPELETFGFDVYCEDINIKGCGDQVCISSSENMDMLSTVWSRALRVTSGDINSAYNDGRLRIGAHWFLAEHMWSHGLSPRLNLKPRGSAMIDNPLNFPEVAKAMLQDISNFDALGEDDIACLNMIFETLRNNELWSSNIPELLSFAKTKLNKSTLQGLSNLVEP